MNNFLNKSVAFILTLYIPFLVIGQEEKIILKFDELKKFEFKNIESDIICYELSTNNDTLDSFILNRKMSELFNSVKQKEIHSECLREIDVNRCLSIDYLWQETKGTVRSNCLYETNSFEMTLMSLASRFKRKYIDRK